MLYSALCICFHRTGAADCQSHAVYAMHLQACDLGATGLHAQARLALAMCQRSFSERIDTAVRAEVWEVCK